MIWDKMFLRIGINHTASFQRAKPGLSPHFSLYLRFAALVLLLGATAVPLHGREKNAFQYGEGLIVNIPLPETEVEQVVEDVAQNTIIRGTKEYNRDEYVAGAAAMTSTPVFPAYSGIGKVFYKVRKQALDPRHFKDSQDVGTLAVRYIVQPQGDKNTILRIDALFVEDFRRSVHQSDGSVESAEYKDIQARLASVELVKRDTEEALREKQERQATKNSARTTDAAPISSSRSTSMSADNTDAQSTMIPSTNGAITTGQTAQTSAPSASSPSASAASATPNASEGWVEDETLQQRVADLRRQVVRVVKQPGAPLKSAPYHDATTVLSLQPGTEVLIQISTTYWYGIETHDGQHGWIRRDQLEQAR
ncbi:MAG: SH3 domain-containing protein [Terriglobales bacterium]